MHGLRLHGLDLVVKVTFRDTRQNFETDFRLFQHARAILRALKLSDEKANIVGSMFDAVNKSERSVLAEFDLRREALAMRSASSLLAEWPERHAQWQRAVLHRWPVALAAQPQWQVAIPECVQVQESALLMTSAPGESLLALLERRPEEAATVFLLLVVPFVGWLLLTKSSQVAHVDPHLGNFRWDGTTLWVLDWGSTLQLNEEKRGDLQLLVQCVAHDAEELRTHLTNAA